MKIRFLLPFVLLLLAAQDSQIAISSPAAGEVVRGDVAIAGTMDAPNFFSAQLDFTYASPSAGTWYTLQTFSQPVVDSLLFLWKTSAITDGDYQLRLRVTLVDGTFEGVIVPITIQNDVAISLHTPTPTSAPNLVTVQIPTPFLLAASPTPMKIPRPTPAPFPANPASLNQNEIFASLKRGALVIIGLGFLSLLLMRLRQT